MHNTVAKFFCCSPVLLKRGVLSAIVILVIVVLSIFMIQFHRVSRQSQSTTFGLEQREVAHQMVEVAMEEAFTRFQRESLNGKSQVAAWLIRRDAKVFALQLPFAEKKIHELARGNQDPILESDAHIIQTDFRGVDSRNNKYYGSEGVGSVRLSTRIWLESAAKTAKKPAYCELIRVHDYKIVSTRTKRDNSAERGEYAHNFPLDFALLIRKGFEEYNAQPFAQNLNNDRVSLVVDQRGIPPEDQGKIFVGGTSRASGKFVFLNVQEKFGKEGGDGIIPKPSKTDDTLTFDECMILFPKLKQNFEAAPPPQAAMDKIKAALKGIFKIRFLPMIRAAYTGNKDLEDEKKLIDLLLSKENGPGENSQKGIEPLGPDISTVSGASPERVFEGDLRQRFLKRVDFHMEDTGNALPKEYADQLKNDTNLTCSDGMEDNPQDDADKKEIKQKFVEGLRQISQTKNFDYFSKLIASYPYKTGLTGDPQPGFPEFRFRNISGDAVDIETTGQTGVQPFFHVNLWAKRMESNEHLEAVGIIDNDKGTITLNGFSCVEASVVIGQEGQTLKIKGQGGIFSKGNITINANLVKESAEDFCVFFTRSGAITVNSTRVEASLIAMGNGSGRVVLRKPVTIKGALVAEYLALSNWAGGTHTIDFDAALKSRNVDNYIVNFGPAISYQRSVEGMQ